VEHFEDVPLPGLASGRHVAAYGLDDGSQLADAVVNSDPAGESEPFLAAGERGIIDRMAGETLLVYPAGVGGQPAATFHDPAR
jgi:hypothetical protein